MPLQIWLPLTEGCENKGLKDVNLTVSNVTPDNGGKLGKCHHFASADGSYIQVNQVDIVQDAWTAALWVYPEVATTTNQWLVTINGTSASTFKLALSFYSRYFSVRLAGTDYRSTARATLNNWYHYCVTYHNNTLNLYVNGELVRSDSSTVTPSNTRNFTVGSRQGLSGSFTGKLNDVRIYDHVLSVKEIKALAQGLVAHYPLNTGWGRANLLKTVPGYFSRTGYQVYRALLSENLVADTTYTIQLWDIDIYHSDKTEEELNVSLYWGGGTVMLQRWQGTAYFTNGHADYLVATITPTATQASKPDAANAWFNIYNSTPASTAPKYMTIGRWKIEKGDTATPWQPCVDDVGYTLPTVYDTSGNGYNAEMNTLLGMTPDTARNTVAPIFNLDEHIVIDNLVPTAEYANSYTFAWWAKFTYASSKMMWGFADGNRYNLYMYTNGTYLNVNAGATNSFDVTISATQYGDNKWHHFALTGDGTEVKLYIDGEYKNSAAEYVGLTGSTIVFNGYALSDKYNFNGSLSDFRIYATPLSADDIRSLYNLAASISNKSVALVPGEFIEQSTAPKIRKTGVFQAEEILEDSAVSIEADALKAADFIEL